MDPQATAETAPDSLNIKYPGIDMKINKRSLAILIFPTGKNTKEMGEWRSSRGGGERKRGRGREERMKKQEN